MFSCCKFAAEVANQKARNSRAGNSHLRSTNQIADAKANATG